MRRQYYFLFAAEVTRDAGEAAVTVAFPGAGFFAEGFVFGFVAGFVEGFPAGLPLALLSVTFGAGSDDSLR